MVRATRGRGGRRTGRRAAPRGRRTGRTEGSRREPPRGNAAVCEGVGQARTGRPRVTSRAALEQLGFELLARRGLGDTTLDDIAAAAGIGRRTFFGPGRRKAPGAAHRHRVRGAGAELDLKSG
ncbi:TetR family transcriptional regulator [Streptomyces sp. NPDC051987]|uniref:TetR family transcriptional regulator n=1 Tax=Streptomyces sp. NPDC051987 TaxID=3155808 RepID=UPI003424F691